MSNYYTTRLLRDGEVPSPPFDGLQSALDAIYDTWGGKKLIPTAVYRALGLGGGKAVVATDAGPVLLERVEGRPRVRLADRRQREYSGTLALVQYWPHDNSQDTLFQVSLRAVGLWGLVESAAARVASRVGFWPECMSPAAFAYREASIRANLTKAAANGQNTVRVLFPSSKVAKVFYPPATNGPFYWAALDIDTAEPTESKTFKRHEPLDSK